MAKVKFDGHEYKRKEDIPDFGSIQCVWSSDDGRTRNYQGHTADALKLPKYDDLATGSKATLIDPNGVDPTIIAYYDTQIKQWLNLKGGVIV